MALVKFVLTMENNNLWKQLAIIIYVINVLKKYVKVVIIINVQYVDKKTGLNVMNIYKIVEIFKNELLWVYYFNYLYFIIIISIILLLFKHIYNINHIILFILL